MRNRDVPFVNVSVYVYEWYVAVAHCCAWRTGVRGIRGAILQSARRRAVGLSLHRPGGPRRLPRLREPEGTRRARTQRAAVARARIPGEARKCEIVRRTASLCYGIFAEQWACAAALGGRELRGEPELRAHARRLHADLLGDPRPHGRLAR